MAKKVKTQSKKKTILHVRAEYLFIVLGVIFGLFFVFVNPPWQSNDEDRHFVHSYFMSHGQILPQQGDNKIGGPIPSNIVEVPKKFQGIRFSEKVKISKKRLGELEDVPLNPFNKQFYHDHLYSYNPVGYVPTAAGIAFGQVFDSNPVSLNRFGRIGGLAFYLVIIFFAIRITPVFKNVFFLYALTPMVLYQGSSVTYDVLSIALTFLFFALVLKYSLDENSFVTWKELLLLILILIIHRFSKDGYPLIPFLIFLIPPRKFKIPVNTLVLFALMFLFCVSLYWLPEWTWRKIVTAQGYHLETSKALHKDLMKSHSLNLEFQLMHPGKLISNIFGNLNHFRQEWTGGTIGRFGYSYTLLPDLFFFIHGLVLIVVAFLDSKKDIVVKFYQKSIVFIVGFGSVLGIIFMSYIYSPVGANMIFGLQGRYLINAVPILLFLLYNNKFETGKMKKWGAIAIAIYICISLIYTLVYLDGVFYSTP